MSVISRWRFRKLGAFPPPLWGRAREGVRAIALLFFLGAIANAQTFTPRDESPEEFPAGAGRDETFYACTACHNFKLIAQQGLSRGQWDETLTFMTRRHNMPEIAGKDRDLILSYLEKTYPPRTQRPGGWRNPFAPQ